MERISNPPARDSKRDRGTDRGCLGRGVFRVEPRVIRIEHSTFRVPPRLVHPKRNGGIDRWCLGRGVFRVELAVQRVRPPPFLIPSGLGRSKVEDGVEEPFVPAVALMGQRRRAELGDDRGGVRHRREDQRFHRVPIERLALAGSRGLGEGSI